MKLQHILPAAALLAAIGAQAQPHPASAAGHAAHHAPAATGAAAALTDAEVRKVDREQGKLTLRHGPLKKFDMPAMTMVFRVADAKMLDGLKEGDKVQFDAEKVNGAFTVTAIQPAR
jgi:Cu(I)/Ag(I) efflux system periplasmic protein CusF